MTTTTTRTILPPEPDLKSTVQSLKKAHPTLGVPKLHALLLSENPTWTVSEKRLRRVLQQRQQQQQQKRDRSVVYPSSTLIEGLDVAKWTTVVQVEYFDRQKGKGLIAREPISEGQVVWKEDPFVIAPEWCVLLSVFNKPVRYFTGKSTICKSRPAHVLTAPRHCSQTRPSSCAVPLPPPRLQHPHARRDSVIVCVSSGQTRRTRSSVPLKTRLASRSSRLRGNTPGWLSTPSPSVPRGCSSLIDTPPVPATRVHCATTGVYTARSRSLEWRSVREDAGRICALLALRLAYSFDGVLLTHVLSQG